MPSENRRMTMTANIKNLSKIIKTSVRAIILVYVACGTLDPLYCQLYIIVFINIFNKGKG